MELPCTALSKMFGEKVANIANEQRKEDENTFVKAEIKRKLLKISMQTRERLKQYREFNYQQLKSFSFTTGLSRFINCDIREDDSITMLILYTEKFCKDLSLSFSCYGVTCFSFVWFSAFQQHFIAAEYLKPLTKEIFVTLKIENIPRDRGAKGGRPKNPHKKEALELARDKWEVLPTAGLAAVVTVVKHRLEKKYTNAPKIATIKAWLINADFRPKESRR